MVHVNDKLGLNEVDKQFLYNRSFNESIPEFSTNH